MRNKYLLILAICVIAVAFYYCGGAAFFSYENLQAKKEYLKLLVEHDYWRAVIYFILIYFTATAFSIPAAVPLTLLGGYLFGTVPGALYSLIASLSGVMITFVIVRYLLASFLLKRYKDRIADFHQRIGKEGVFGYITTLHLLAVVPYMIITTLAALAGISIGMFLLTAIVGATPVLFIYALAGAQLGTVDSVRDIFAPHVIIALTLLIGCALMPVILRLYRSRKSKQ